VENLTLRGMAEAIEQSCAITDADALAAEIGQKLAHVDPALIAPGNFLSTDAMLLMVDHGLPGWTIMLSGVASEKDGHWTCTLRNSAGRDNDPFVGIGKCASLPLAILAAFLKALAFID